MSFRFRLFFSCNYDILFNSKTNVNSIQYAGRGNGTVTSDDDLTKVRRILGESHSVYINLNNYLKSGSTDIQSLRNAAGQLLTVIKSWSFKTTDSEGGAGGYSRFVLKDYSDIDCINGNCLAKGGDGATGNTLVNCSSAMVTYTTAFCNVNSLDNKCSCSLSSNNKDLYSCLYNKSASSSVFNCNASSTNVLGAGGGAGSGAYLSNGYSMQGYGGIGGGGAIIIKW